jgi:DNA modification methylase
MAMPDRPRGTSTSKFGVSRRESHDASDFYARFRAPILDGDDTVHGPLVLDEPLRCGDSRDMDLPDRSVALVATSPPYFAGKEYEAALGQGHVPGSYLDYLQMLRDVFAECVRVLEPGGRIAVNVANLGRKPYRSLSADVVRILEEDLGLLLRGEVIWTKAEGASGSCAWGSFRSASNPVLRDVTERVVIASKGRFDRALPPETRQARGLPHRSTLTNDEFMEATLDVWRITPESARRVGHPAPFPVELPLRLIALYTYVDDLVLDPFLGSGSTAVAAARSGRRYVGYDTDPAYVEIARERVAAVGKEDVDAFVDDPLVRDGGSAHDLAEAVLRDAGFDVVGRNRNVPGVGLAVGLVVRDRSSQPCEWYVDVTGAFTTARAGGLARADVLWRCLGRASVLAARGVAPLLLLTSQLPPRRSAGDRALRAVGRAGFFDAVELLGAEGVARLARYAAEGPGAGPLPGFWAPADLAAGG